MDITQLLGEARDAITVKRVFGEAYEQDGTTVIPVARVSGGGGGGSGGEGREQRAQGGGMGFGVKAEPAGVYVIKDGAVHWEPAVDVNRIVLGMQLVALAVLFTVRTALRRRRKRKS